MFCGGCGKPVLENAKFCAECGRPIINRAAYPQEKIGFQANPVQQNFNRPQSAYSQPSAPNIVSANNQQKSTTGCLLKTIIGIAAVTVMGVFILFTVILLIPDEYLDEGPVEGAGGASPYIDDSSPYENTDQGGPGGGPGGGGGQGGPGGMPSGAGGASTIGGHSGNTSEYSGEGSPVSSSGVGVYGELLDIDGLRDFYTTSKGDGSDIHTVMMYFMGSDLESDGGFASSDITEMLDAYISDNVNLIVMTGGTTDWTLQAIDDGSCQYWQIKDGQMIPVNSNLGRLNMSSAQTLQNFITDTASSFPADRYSLVLWNHGGGTMGGFGYDEYYPDSTLHLDQISYALEQSGIDFDFIGFDACLMATAETALMLEPHADFLIASQEMEPASGWYYTDWLSELSENPSMSTIDIGVNIVDDFVTASENEYRKPEATLSIIELRQMPYIYEVLTDYFNNSIIDINNNEYIKISQARSDAKDFGEGEYEQIDLVDYVLRADVDGTEEVVAAVDSAVRYRYNSSDVLNAYGMAMYFPYDYLREYAQTQDILHNVGFSEEYTQFFDSFISAMSGGQQQFSHNRSGGTSHEDYTNESWYDVDTASLYQVEYSGEFLGELSIDEKDDGFVLSLSDEEWDDINKIELQVLLDDGEGYIDLGSDNVFEFDKDGDLIIGFDYTWVTLDGHTVPFYAEEEFYGERDWYTYGKVPAYLNDEYVEIIVYWDSETPQGYVAGYRKYNEAGTPAAKGLFEIQQGDVIEWVADHYSYGFEYEDSYIFGDPYTATGGDIVVSYDHIGDMDTIAYFVLTDYYNNTYETEAVIYTD